MRKRFLQTKEIYITRRHTVLYNIARTFIFTSRTAAESNDSTQRNDLVGHSNA